MLTVRDANPSDAEAITRIHVRSWQWAYASLMPAGYLATLDRSLPQRIAQRARQLRDLPDDRRMLVVEGHDDVVAGFANIGRYRNDQRSGDLVDGVGEVYAIYVEPGSIGTGAGRALMDAAVAWFTSLGWRPVRLWVLDGNARARRFYERYGFRLDGARSVFTLDHPGQLPIPLAEVRYSLDPP